ncbi:hypothetical protein CU098_009618, partial [Rhizopus stolonifer]
MSKKALEDISKAIIANRHISIRNNENEDEHYGSYTKRDSIKDLALITKEHKNTAAAISVIINFYS